MPKAFVLINSELGIEEELAKKLSAIQNITQVNLVYGNYDMIAKVEANTLKKVKDIITWKIRHLAEVKSTLTMIAVES